MQRRTLAIGAAWIAASLGACSIERLALDSLSGVLASGYRAFESDDDPELVGEALPFSLKLIDGLLLEQPEHPELLLAGASGYASYARVYVSLPADRLSRENIDAAREMRARARSLLLRAYGYGMRALELEHPGLERALMADPGAGAASLGESDIEAMYWTAAALGLAISASRNEPALLARLPEVEALLERALAIDEAWDEGALHEFALNLGDITGMSAVELTRHYERAVTQSAGRRASVHVSYAEAVALPRQDRAAFVTLLERALAIDVDAYPSERLANVITQRRARRLMADLDRLFLE